MGAAGGAEPRACGFGSLQTMVWGAGWAASGGSLELVLGAADATRVARASVEAGPDGTWRLIGQGLELALRAVDTPAADAAGGAGADPPTDAATPADSADELCRVEGHLELEGIRHGVSCLGWRAWWPPLEIPSGGSLRQVAAWPDPETALTLLAVRPRRARGHEADVVLAGLIETGGRQPVAEGRLSTTYGADGMPRRAGAEIWLGEGQELYPRRAAGEPAGPWERFEADGQGFTAQLFRWHCCGREGCGVYLMGSAP